MTSWMPTFFATWNWVDWSFWAIVVLGACYGLWRGLSHELAVLLSYVFAILVTRLAYEPLANWLGRILSWSPDILRLTAVLLSLAAAILLMWGVRLVFGKIMSFAFKGWLERGGGLLAGAFRWGILGILLLHILSLLPSAGLQRAILYDSVTGRELIPCAAETYNDIAAKAYLPPIENPTGLRLPQSDAVYMPPPVDASP